MQKRLVFTIFMWTKTILLMWLEDVFNYFQIHTPTLKTEEKLFHVDVIITVYVLFFDILMKLY